MGNRFEREGQQLESYHLIKRLGGGAFGEVYMAEDRRKRQVAIKILHGEFTSQQLQLFLSEARVIRLRHEHIVSVLDFGIEPTSSTPYIVMDYATQGTLLNRHPRGSRLPLSTIVPYVQQIASALYEAHEEGIIHRDVKPENILLDANGTIKLADFGIAVISQSAGTSLESPQSKAGTPWYMAPEQIQGKPSRASDQYALAVIVYEWLTGEPPFNGGILEVYGQHLHATPDPLPNDIEHLTPEFEAVLMKALSKNPKDRFPTVLDFATALEEASRDAIVLPKPSSSFPLSTSLYPSRTLQQSEEQINNTPPTSTKSSAVPISGLQQNAVEISLGAPPKLGITQTDKKSIPQTSIPRKVFFSLLSLVLLIGISVGLVYTTGKRASDNAHATATATLYTKQTVTIQTHATATAQVQRTAINAYNQAVAIDGIMFGFNAQHTHANPYEKILSPTTVSMLTKKWASPTGERISSPAVVNGVVYIGSFYFDSVYAIDATTGAKKWAFPTGANIDSSPAVAGGVVYIGSYDHNVYAIDATSGTKKWAFPTTDTIISSPVVAGGVVYVASYDNNVYAIDAATGTKKWAYRMEANTDSSPAVAGGVVYIGSGDGKLYAIDAATGAKKWAYQTANSIYSSPAVVNGVVYVGSDDHNVYAIDAATGTKKWAFPTGGAIGSSPAVVNGVVYIGSYDHNVYAIDAASGAQKWAYQTVNNISSLPAVVDGVVYVSMDHNLFAFHLPDTPEQ